MVCRTAVLCVLAINTSSFGTTFREHPVLRYNAVAFLLTLAFADGALFGFRTESELRSMTVQEGKEVPLRWNDEWMDRPILRGCSGGKVGDGKLSSSTFQAKQKIIFEAAGYVGVRASVHSIRRYLGKQID